MSSARWVEECCTQAIYESSRMGIEAAATNERTVACWNIMLRANCEHFPLPDPKIHKQQRPLPDLLEYFHEEITLPWVGYCNTNLANLTVESAWNELIIKIIPKCSIQSQANEDDDDEDNYERSSLIAASAGVEGEKESTNEQKQPTIKDCLLSRYREQPISIGSTWRWLRRFLDIVILASLGWLRSVEVLIQTVRCGEFFELLTYTLLLATLGPKSYCNRPRRGELLVSDES